MDFEKIEGKGYTWYIFDKSKVIKKEGEKLTGAFSRILMETELAKNTPDYLRNYCHCIIIDFQKEVFRDERGFHLVNEIALVDIKEKAKDKKILVFFEMARIKDIRNDKVLVRELKEKNKNFFICRYIGGMTIQRFLNECRLEDSNYQLNKQLLIMDLKRIELINEHENFGNNEKFDNFYDREKFINNTKMPLLINLSNLDGLNFHERKERCILRYNLLSDILLEEKRLAKNLTTLETMDNFIEKRFIKLIYGNIIRAFDKTPLFGCSGDDDHEYKSKKRKREFEIEEKMDYMVSNEYSQEKSRLFDNEAFYSEDRESRMMLTFAFLLQGSKHMISSFLEAERLLLKFKIRRYYNNQKVILEFIEHIKEDQNVSLDTFGLVECDPEKEKSLLKQALSFFKLNHPDLEKPKKWFKTPFLNVLDVLPDWNLFIFDGIVYLNYFDLMDFFITEKMFKNDAEALFSDENRQRFTRKFNDIIRTNDPDFTFYFKHVFIEKCKDIVEICSKFERNSNVSINENVYDSHTIDIEDLVSPKHLYRVPLCVVNQLKKIESSGIMDLKHKERFQITGYLMNLKYYPNDISLFFRQKDKLIGPDFDKKLNELEHSYIKTRKRGDDGIFMQNGCSSSSNPDNTSVFMSAACPFSMKSDPEFVHNLSKLLNTVGISNIQNQNEIIEKAKESKFTHIPCQLTFNYAHHIFKEDKYDPFKGKPIIYPFQYTNLSVQSELEREKKKGLISYFV